MAASKFRFVGCANPPGREEGYNGFELDRRDVVKASSELVGAPLLIEHGGPSVGCIDDAWVAKDGRLLVCGSTCSDTVRGLYAKNMIAGGGYPELSIGSTVFVDPDALKVTGKSYHEVSIVERGLRDGTTIDSKSRTRLNAYKARPVPFRCSARPSAAAMADSAAPTGEPAPVSEAAAEVASQQVEAPVEPAAAAAAAEPAAGQPTAAEASALSENQIARMTNDELMARVAALQSENKWLGDKTKRSYEAAFDAATEKFLADLKTEDTDGKIAFINSLKQMTQQPGLAGREGNAVMEVAVAASRQNRQLQTQVETQFQELKRLRGGGGAPPATAPAAIGGAAAAPAAAVNFAAQTNRGAPAPIQRQRAQAAKPPSVHHNKKMFDWIAAAPRGVGMETMNYNSVAGKDFSKTAAAYNQSA